MRFEKTKAAVERWDQRQAEVQAMWDEALKSGACAKSVLAFEKKLADEVREAFADDTSDVNSRERAFLVHPLDPFVRRLIDPTYDERMKKRADEAYQAYLRDEPRRRWEAQEMRWKARGGQ